MLRCPKASEVKALRGSAEEQPCFLSGSSEVIGKSEFNAYRDPDAIRQRSSYR
jgi:hypothetical protein